ncbi:MAG: primosomal protein N', partial [Alphaproteobacteria bacterium]
MIPEAKTASQPLTGQVEILLPGVFDHGFDYLLPAGMAADIGQVVRVPFGRSDVLGIVSAAGAANLQSGKIKNIINILDDVLPLSPDLIAFAKWVAWYNCTALGTVIKMILPIADIDKEGRVKEVVSHNIAPHSPHLSDIQQKAASQLKARLSKGFSVTLLDGVTGSGKTEVYFDAIAETLAGTQDAQILVLLPEIALSIQWLDRFKKRFGFRPVVWNSEVTKAQKRTSWKALARGEARVVVGARSALFLPYRNLQLLILDEEHDASYKQEEGVIYHARDMAVARARFEKIPVVLVSATPSLETHYNAKQGRYAEIVLPNRHGDAQMPDIRMVDMRAEKLPATSFISKTLRDVLTQTLAAGHQSMLFLNRRGYAPLMLCRTCGHRFQCPDCSSWLVLHKKATHDQLRCHHCNHSIPVPQNCPACSAEDSLHACGPGVERVQEEISVLLPNARIAVLASDHTDNVKLLTEIIEAMERKEVDILIGTQMIAKGHHFAGIATVGVVDADLGLGGGDLRAAEKTYQLLHQLSGRAGRESIKGTVYLQSYLPEHPVMKALMKGGRDEFLAAELDARREAEMPPFSRLAAIIVEGTKEDAVIKTAKTLAASINHQLSTINL